MENESEGLALTKEERRRRRAEIRKQEEALKAQEAAFLAQQAAVQAQKAAMGYASSDSNPDPELTKSPVRKRKSDVLAEASPVKHKSEQARRISEAEHD